jgi:hypothetical protein
LLSVVYLVDFFLSSFLPPFLPSFFAVFPHRWQRERRSLQRVAQVLGLQFQQERALRGQLQEHELAQLVEAVVAKDRDLQLARAALGDVQEEAQRYMSQPANHANPLK